MSLEITGTLLVINDTQQVSDKFKKREFVLDIKNGQYSDSVLMQTVQDKTSLLDPFAVGDEVSVAFNLRGRTSDREGEKRYFTNVEAWRISAK